MVCTENKYQLAYLLCRDGTDTPSTMKNFQKNCKLLLGELVVATRVV